MHLGICKAVPESPGAQGSGSVHTEINVVLNTVRTTS